MAEAARACPIDFNPLAPTQLADPYPVYARARRVQPVFYASEFGFWVVTRYDDVLAVLKDHRTFSSQGALRSSASDAPPEVTAVLAEGFPDMPIIVDTDPPLHTRIRGLVTKAFTPRRIAEMEPRIVAIATELIDGFAGDGEVDLIDRFAWPLPLIGIGDMLGCPRADLPDLHRWSHDWLTSFQGTGSVEEQVGYARSIVTLQRYFAEALEERVREARDDLMTALLEARLDGETPLTIEEAAGVPLDLIVAGHVTVTRALGSALVLLFDHADALAGLRADPTGIPAAVEEILRLESPAQGLFRTTTREVELGGATLPPGARVMVHYASANRDDLHFADADQFRPDRDDLGRHVAFGKGIHFCIGAPLARLELRIALELLLRRLPNLRLDPTREPERERIFFGQGFSHLYIRWDPPGESSKEKS